MGSPSIAQAFLPLTEETWVGGSGGVARIVGEHIISLRGEAEQRFEGTSGVVMSNDGALWLNFAAGIACIPAEELRRLRADSGHKVSYELLDHNDGLRGVATQLRPLPSAFKEAGGRLWFSTGRNLHWIDPERIPRNSRPPVVEIHGVKSRGQLYPPSARVQLPVGAARKLRREVREQVYRIGREALVNAFKHSEALRIDVMLRFEADAFIIEVRDDGKGVTDAVLAPGQPSKHWGVKGMHERARSLGAKLTIYSAPGEGTRIELHVPGGTAFQPSRRQRQWRSIAGLFQRAGS